MNFRFARASTVAFAAAAVLGLAACGSGSGAPESAASSSGPASGEITVYNAQHASLTQAWVDEFTKETGIKVTLRQGDDTEMSSQLVQEGSASPADVFITENSPAMTQVEKAGLFADIPDDVKAQVPEQYRPSSDKWIGVAARSTVFVYNKNKLNESQLPASLMDLQNPEWKGRWGAAPSGADFQAIISAMLELKGEAATSQWLKAMKTNAVSDYKGNGAVLKAVNAGEIDGGVIYHYYYFGDQAKTGENSNNVGQHYFKNQDPGAFVSVSGAGVLKSSKNPKAADEFVKFITGKKGQEVLQTTSYEYTVNSDVPANDKLVPLSELDAPKVDPAHLNGAEVTKLMTGAGLL